MCEVDFCTTHGQNKTCKCNTDGFVPVASLNGMVVLPSLFIISLMGRTEKYDISYTWMKNELLQPLRSFIDVTELLMSNEFRDFGSLLWTPSR